MADWRSKPRVRRQKSDVLTSVDKAKQKETRKQHQLRLTESTWVRWTQVKQELRMKNHDELAVKLLDIWDTSRKSESDTAQPEIAPFQEVSVRPTTTTPVKLRDVAFSTPVPSTSKVAWPVFEAVSDISEGSSSESGNGYSEMSLLGKYEKKAKETTGSFINITFETEGENLEKDPSYVITLSEEEEEEETDYDSGEESEDFTLDMSLNQELPEGTDVNAVPVRTASEKIFHVEDDEGEGSTSGEDSDEDVQDRERDIIREKKAICFEEEIMALANMKIISTCSRKGCMSKVSPVKKYIGTALQLKWVCVNNHEVQRWDSQPKLKRMRAGNFLMSSSMLASGNNYDKVRLLFKFFGMKITGATTHYQIQAKHSVPVIKEHFANMMEFNLEKYSGKEVVLAGDGRMDSPGHSAQFCTYTLMEYESKDILACEIIEKRMTGLKSTNMEKEGLKRGIQSITARGVKIKELCTDASTSIAAMIRNEYPDILHSYDVWHGAKNFGKKIGSVAAEGKNKELKPWVPNIINHFWYCSRKAQGNEFAMLARWRGLLHHVTNIHEWVLGDEAIEPKCEHGPLQGDDSKWLEAGGTAHLALTDVMMNVRFQRTLHHYANFRHTGDLETFHEHILMYAAKRYAYTYPIYKARNYLAVIDYQNHKDRPVLLDRNGKARLHRTYSKRNGNWSCYQEKQPKLYSYIPDLLGAINSHYMSSTAALREKLEMTPSDPRKIKRTLAEISPPPTHTLMTLKKSRFESDI